MKKNVMMRLASFLLVAVLISTSAISGTYAKYVTEATAKDTARVAAFGVQVAADFTEVFKEKYDTTDEETEEIRQRVVLDTVIKGNDIEVKPDGDRFLKVANRFINIDKLDINIVDSINPFQRAYEVLSKNVNAPLLKVIQDTISEQKYDMSLEEAIMLFKGPLKAYIAETGKEPDITSPNMKVQRLAMALAMIRNQKRRHMMGLDFDPKSNS